MLLSKSFADLLKLNFSLILKSLLTDLAPLISQANFVIFNLSSTEFTFPVRNILPSRIFVFNRNNITFI